MKIRRRLSVCAAVLVLPLAVSAQQPTAPVPPPLSPIGPAAGATDASTARMEAARVKLMNDDRHKRLVADTDKMVALSTQLQAEVAKTNKDELSVEVIRTADQLEKLAHDVKERMKN